MSERSSSKSKSRSSSRSRSSEKRRSKTPSRFASKFSGPKKAAQIFDRVVTGPYEKMAMQTAMRTVQHEFVGQPSQFGRDVEYEKKNNPGVKYVAHPVMPPKNSPSGAFHGRRYGKSGRKEPVVFDTRRVQHRPKEGSPSQAFRRTRRYK